MKRAKKRPLIKLQYGSPSWCNFCFQPNCTNHRSAGRSKLPPSGYLLPKNVHFVCEITFENGRGLTHEEASQFVRVLRKAARKAFPTYSVRGSWIHKGCGGGWSDSAGHKLMFDGKQYKWIQSIGDEHGR